MEYKQNALFQAPHHLFEFSANGYVMGSFQANLDQGEKGYIPGFLVTKEGVELIASIKNRYWENLTKNGTFSPEEQLYWRVYFRTTREGKLTNINLIRPKRNLEQLKEDLVQEDLSEITDIFQVRGRIQKILEKELVVRLKRNEKPPKGKENSYLWKPFYLNIQGNLPSSATPEQFWEIFCIRDGDYLKLKRAVLITEEMAKVFEKNSSPNSQKLPAKSKNKSANQSQKSQTSSQGKTVIESESIMINGQQMEITVKFTERPDVPAQGKKVSVEITAENGVVVKAELNRKTFSKQVQKIETFEDWIGALSGKVSEITTEGLVILETASVQIFEKKQKNKPSEQPTELSEKKEASKTESVAAT